MEKIDITDCASSCRVILREEDFETQNSRERCIWTAERLRLLCQQAGNVALADSLSAIPSSKVWFEGFTLIGRANYHSPNHIVPPEVFAQHYEIIFIDKGNQNHWINGRLYNLNSGDCLFIRPMEQHSTAQQSERRGRFYWWIFNPLNGFLGLDTYRSSMLLAELQKLFCDNYGQPKAVCHLTSSCSVQLRTVLASLFQDWGKTTLQNPLVWEHRLLGIYFLILHSQKKEVGTFWEGVEQQGESSKENWKTENFHTVQRSLQLVCRYIARHIDDDISFTDLYHLTPYSKIHLQRLFREHYGLPLRDYINREKNP